MNDFRTVKCLNCETEFQGDFCPKCGQKAKTERFTIKSMAKSLFLSIFSIDGGVWITVKSLFTRPGRMVLDIINGKRKRYFSPFPMLLLALSLYIIIFSFTGSEKSKIKKNYNVEVVESENKQDEDLLDDEKFDYAFVKFFNFYANHYTIVSILTIPISIFCARICYGRKNRKRYYWGEYCIPIIYSLIIVTFYRCLTSIMFYFYADFYEKVTSFTPIISVVALSACFKEMLEFGVVNTVLRSCFVYGIYILFLIILVISGVYLFGVVM
ncbi:MAG: DUF3667 domain-containing protein [Alphaproteobacteria bacterium]|nr:DUF3667 domain-containing protein [Alphaproteobacteria bacterium]